MAVLEATVEVSVETNAEKTTSEDEEWCLLGLYAVWLL
jgi:hypothetical protein